MPMLLRRFRAVDFSCQFAKDISVSHMHFSQSLYFMGSEVLVTVSVVVKQLSSKI